jgi:PKD repeat protein
VLNGFCRVALLSVAALVVTGCGGGGSGGAPPPPPPVQMPPSTPVISATPTSPVVRQPISFSVTSTDPQSGTLSYAWDFGDSGTGVGSSITHSYAALGKYTVKVIATDQVGLSSNATTDISVTAPPPGVGDIEIFGNGILLGQSVKLFGFAVDPNNLALTFSWDFGDSGTASGASVHHEYQSVGTYVITLTVTNSGGGSASKQVPMTVKAPVAPPVPQDNALSAYCNGPFCGAVDAGTYSGAGVGIWRYNNTTSSDATINVAINGVQAGQTAILTFSNGQPSAAASVPAPGALLDMVTAPLTAASTRQALANRNHTLVLERNSNVADAFVRNFAAREQRVVRELGAKSQARFVARAAPAIGTARTWNDGLNSVPASVQASCPLSTGRNAVFWVDQALVDQSALPAASLATLVTVYCGSGNGYADLVSLLGDAWGPAAASSTALIQDAPGALQDINIVIPKKLSIDASGYFSNANNFTLAANSTSNQALVVFLNGEQLVLPQEATTYASVLIHESTHLINYYQRVIARGTAHDVWLEETSAMMSEDIVSPAAVPGFDETLERQEGLLLSGGDLGYIGWTAPGGGSYNQGGTFGAFLNRRYGLNIYKQLITDCVDGTGANSSYQCMDKLISQNGGLGFADEFARMGASIYGGMPGGNLPRGFGLPGIVADGYFLAPYDASVMRNPALVTPPQPLTNGFLATSQTYQIDSIATGKTLYQRSGIVVPANTTMILVIQ